MFLKSKIILVMAITIIFTVGITSAIIIKIQSNKMIEEKIKDAEFLGDIIAKSIETAMNTGHQDDILYNIQSLSQNKEVLSLRIVSPEGEILKSPRLEEVGTRLGNAVTNQAGSLSQKATLIDDYTISYVKAIANGESCQRCHDSNKPVIGSVHVKLDATRSKDVILSMKRLFFFWNIVFVLIVSLVLSILFSRLVLKPLKNLLSAIREVESGNLQASVVDVKSDDELGTVGEAFNNMIQEINRLYKKNLSKEKELSKIRIELAHKDKVEELNAQLEFKIKELETANRAVTALSREIKSKNLELEKAVERMKKITDVGRMLTSIIETEELMKIIIRTTADIIDAEKVVLHLKNEKKSPITVQYTHGIGIDILEDFSLQLNPSYAEMIDPAASHGNGLGLNDLSSSLGTSRSRVTLPLILKGQSIGAMILENKLGNVFTEEELEILTTLSNQAMVAIENAWLYESVKRNYFSTIQSFVNALEANDTFTKGHSERVRSLCLELGRHIGLDYRELETLEHAAILHDIGKIGIDSFILNKQGKLTSKEYDTIKSHPLIGEGILSPIETLEGVRQTIIQHHERYDGKGYPFGLRGAEVSLKARILTVVDTFDAMMTDRPYRKSLSLLRTQEEMRLNSGSQFDPYVVNAFTEMLDLKGEAFLLSAGYNLSQTFV